MSYQEIPWQMIDKRQRIIDLLESITLETILEVLERVDSEKVILKYSKYANQYKHPEDPDDIPF